MKKLLYICAISVLTGYCTLQASAATGPSAAPTEINAVASHPTETKVDQLMEGYINKLQAAFAEQDDVKTIAMIQAAVDELVPKLEEMRPEIESWARSMSEQDKQAYRERARSKPYVKTMLELVYNPDFARRMESNPALQQAMQDASARTQALNIKGVEPAEGDSK